MILSIIIPIYNVEKYLSDCLDSCLRQDVPPEDYEIICVNDGSPDNCGQILEEYKRKYSNLVVINQENAGLSTARNVGMDAARGEFLWFVDGDDFIEENILGTLFEILSATDADRICCRHYEFEEALTDSERALRKDHALTPTNTPTGQMLWESMFRRSLLQSHGLRFFDGYAYIEDALFFYEFGRCEPRILKLELLVYYYRRNNTSITRTKNTETRQKKVEAVYKMAQVIAGYTIQDNAALLGRNASRREKITVLMPSVRSLTISAAKLPKSMRREILQLLSSNGLFPLFLYRKPRDWFPHKAHINHAHMGLKGYILDILHFYSTTHLGFLALLLFNKLRKNGV